MHMIRMTRSATLATFVLVGIAAHAIPNAVGIAEAQVTLSPPLGAQAGSPADTGDPNEYLKQQLILYIRPRLPEEQAFIEYVVLQVKVKHLPASIANMAMLYAREKRPYPFPYFKMAVLKLAEREQIALKHLPPSTTTPQSLPR